MKITPAKAIYSVGDVLTAEFTITNRGSASITFDKLVVGGRGPSGEVVDFQISSNISIATGASHNYTGTLVLPNKTGNYHFFCAYHTLDHLPGEDDNNWNTNIDVEVNGQIVSDFSEARRYRERDITVFASIIGPAPPPQEWQEIITGPWKKQINGDRSTLSRIAVSPNNAKVIYAVVRYEDDYWGDNGDDLYKSSDGGLTWQAVSQGLPTLNFGGHHIPIGAIAAAPSDPNTVYVGTTVFSPYSSVVAPGRGIYKTTNGGSQWVSVGGPNGGWWIFNSYYPISSMVIDPGNPDIVYIGTLENGIWRTKNGGVLWERIWYVDIQGYHSDVNALAISPADSRVIYADVYYYPPDSLHGSGLAWSYRLVRSVDGGNTFTTLPHPETVEFVQHKIDDIAVDSRNANIVYIIAESYKVYGSTDGGNSWLVVAGTGGSNPLPFVEPGLGAWSHSYGSTGAIYIRPDRSEGVYVSGEWGLSYVFFTPNSGNDWFPLGDLKDKHVKDIVITSNTSSYVTYATAIEGLFAIVLSSSRPGDAFVDGTIDDKDITKVERIIAHLDSSTPGGDANQDGNINSLDITKVERLIAGLN